VRVNTIPGFRPFVGQHCETVATGSLLKAVGMKLSEAETMELLAAT
jgi:hypothetical protein